MLHTTLPQIPALTIASLPWLVARTGVWRGLHILLVNRSVELPETDDLYRPVAELLDKYQYEIHSGPEVYLNRAMTGGAAVMTIYRLAVP